jgi:toxin ParE1/3/4
VKSYLVQFRPRARRELIALYWYLEHRFSDDASFKFVKRIEASCLSLATAPQRGNAVSKRDTALRTIGFEHRVSILFRIGEDTVEILRVLYGGQDVQAAIRKSEQR